MRGSRQLEDDLPADSLEQLEEDFSLAAAIGTEAEQDDDTAAAAIKPSSASDDAWDALYSSFKASTQQEEKREKILRFSAIIT